MKKLAFIIVCLLIPTAFFGNTYTQFSHYSVKEGLSEINVLCMLQDKKGQMWFGTFDGLNKFNGYTFKTYKSNPGQVFGLENYRVVSITRRIVTFQTWPKGGKLHLLRMNCGLKAFAEAVRKEIPCPAET